MGDDHAVAKERFGVPEVKGPSVSGHHSSEQVGAKVRGP